MKAHRSPDQGRSSTPAQAPRRAAGGQRGNAARQEQLRAASAPQAAQGGGDQGWWSFVTTAASNLQFDGMCDRFLEARAVQQAVEAGAEPGALGLDPRDHRLRNIAEMTDVAEEVEGKVDHPAAHSLRDANFWFHTLFGNNGGSFEGMDMARYREIAAMPGAQAAEVLPEFEAETFRRSGDPETIEFGNSLPPEQRHDLFMLHNTLLSPGADERR